LLDGVIVKFAVSPCGGKNKFVKKGRVDFWVEKKHTLKKMACGVGLQHFLRVCFLWVGFFFPCLLKSFSNFMVDSSFNYLIFVNQ